MAILSADANAHQSQRLIAAGAVRYLTKPLDVERCWPPSTACSPPRLNTLVELLENYAGMSVLVVDDNPSNVALMQALLETQGLTGCTPRWTRDMSRARIEIDPTLSCSTCTCPT